MLKKDRIFRPILFEQEVPRVAAPKLLSGHKTSVMDVTPQHEMENLRRRVAELERQLADERSAHANDPPKDQRERQWRIVDTALSHTPDSTYIFDLQGRVVYANKTLLNRWRKTLHEAVGEDLRQSALPRTAWEFISSTLQAAIQSSGAVVSQDPLPSVLVEEVHLQQLFQNLIGNAIKYRSEDVPRIHISAARQEPMWRFSVEDNGIRIEGQFAEQVFGLFKRLHSKDAYEGTGIGLAICQKIVNRYGGRIWAESQPGRGSIFYFTLPG